ncbi:hypothetical protein DAETH_32360 [Deinococcus aetherius]|uniref:DUF4397 domain-containing protein n=1 Tax=Deinococcus aetherius TaxID=200252 RepID=A0ABM8AHM5_9DEIO|nr:DUF4397 domain-containing protein [Deinococcus aetherius]BDP43267.1 hypothetical protein DAETH_32360 [Deinococcus aetherius]
MNKLAKTALIPAALVLTLNGTLNTAHAQTTTATTQARPNVLFLADTGRPGAVDVYVDGTRVEAGVQATDRPSLLFLTPGAHDITVKTSLNGQVLATATLNVLPNSLNAVSLQNDYDANGMDYTLALVSGSTAVRNLVNAD